MAFNIHIFGNPLLEEDSLALKVAERLTQENLFPNINFVYLDGLDEIDEESFIMLDAAKNIKEIKVIENLDELYAGKFYTMHDADISMFLKLMQKIKKVKQIKIIALPFDMEEKMAYDEVKKVLESMST